MNFYLELNTEKSNQNMFSLDNDYYEEPLNMNWFSSIFNQQLQDEKYEKQSTFAEEGTVDLNKVPETTEPNSEITIDSLEKDVKQEIDQNGIDFAIAG